MSNTVIAIDGPSASGKSTVARAVARALNYRYVDSGALYRTVTWYALRQGCSINDPVAVAEWVRRVRFNFSVADEGVVRVGVDGRLPPLDALRSDDVVEAVSDVAAVPAVRGVVNDALRDMRRLGSLVVEGRDIGTVVFPETSLKFFVDADPEERARRRSVETGGDVARVGASLRRRDQKDSSREAAPLRRAPDAVHVDTTRMAVAQVVGRILDCANRFKKKNET